MITTIPIIHRRFEDLSVGQSAEVTKTVTKEDVAMFAEISGDRNPIHLDEVYAATTPFGGCVVHGALIGAYVSALIGMEMPGPGCIGRELVLTFRRPVKVGAQVAVCVEVSRLDARRGFVTLRCVCSVNGKTAVDGEAVVYVPKRCEGETSDRKLEVATR